MIGKNVGNILTKETKEKISASKLGRPSLKRGKKASEEAKRNQSIAQMNNTNKKGKKVSDQGRARMRANSQKGKTWKLVDGKRVWVLKEE